MTAIFTGLGAGFQRGSGAELGQAGFLGTGTIGQAGERVSLNAATGNLVINQQDEYLSGLGHDIAVARTYNSLGALDLQGSTIGTSGYGDHWRFVNDRRVFDLTGTRDTAGSTVKRVSGDGAEVTYTWDTTVGRYVATDGSGAHDHLSFNAGTDSWTWYENGGEDGNTEVYSGGNANGTGEHLIESRSDSSGNTVTYAYTGTKLSTITTEDGGQITYNWTGDNITSITASWVDLQDSDGDGNVTETINSSRTYYEYDTSNRLIKVKTDFTPNDQSITDNEYYEVTYTYDGSSNRVATISQSDGSLLTIAYDGSDRVSSLTEKVTGSQNRVTTLTYGTNYTEITNPAGQVTKLTFDGTTKALTKVEAPAATSGGARQTVSYAYDSDGNVTSITTSADSTVKGVTTMEYDDDGNVTKITAPDGRITERLYNDSNALIRETRKPPAGQTGETAHELFVRDSSNRLRFHVGADGNVTEIWLDGAGQAVKRAMVFIELPYTYTGGSVPTVSEMQAWRATGTPEKDQDYSFLGYEYNARGDVVKTTQRGYARLGQWIESEGLKITHLTHDQTGQLIKEQLEGENAASYVYDGLGRMTSSTDIRGGTTAFSFDHANQKTTVTLQAGATLVQTYNHAGDLLSEVRSADTGSAQSTVTNMYEASGRLRYTTDGAGNKTYFIYDNLGQVIAQVDDTRALTEYVYDDHGRVIATASYLGKITSAQLTALADLNQTPDLSTLRSTAGTNSNDIWSFTIYDTSDRVIQTIDGVGRTVTYTYDTFGRLASVTEHKNKITLTQVGTFKTSPPTTSQAPASHADDRVTRNFYDLRGNITGTLNAEGVLTEYEFDLAGRRIRETVYADLTNSADRASGSFATLLAGITADTTADRTTRWVYDGQGLLRYTINALGHVVENVYNEGDDDSAVGVVRKTVAYANAIGTPTDWTHLSVQTAVNAIASADDRTSYFVYDATRQLTYSIAADGAVTGFEYDASGNVIETTAFATLRPTTSLPTDATMDSWANTSGAADDRVTKNFYNDANMLVYQRDAEGYYTRFDYDAAGRLVSKIRYPNTPDLPTNPDVASISALALGTGVSEQYTYYADGKLNQTTFGNGDTVRLYYHATGKLSTELKASGSAEESRTLKIYDASGKLKNERFYMTYPHDNADIIYKGIYYYNEFGDLIEKKDGESSSTFYTHDKLGRVLTVTDPESNVTTNTYNTFGEIVEVKDARNYSSYFYYDQAGRQIATVDAEDFRTSSEYSAFGELTKTTQFYWAASNNPNATKPPTGGTNASRDRVTEYQYDKLGRQTVVTDALYNDTTTTYNAFGQVHEITNARQAVTTHTYDRLGRLTLTEGPHEYQNNKVKTEREYDERGNLKVLREAAGIPGQQRTTLFSYDGANQLLSKVHQAVNVLDVGSGNTAIVSLVENYEYDERGNLIKVTHTGNGYTDRVVTLNWYDRADRLVMTVDAEGRVTQNEYDKNHNLTAVRVFENHVNVTTVAASMTQPVVDASTQNHRSKLYTYDGANRKVTESTEVRNGGGLQTRTDATYVYDGTGNVTSVTDAKSNTTQYVYNERGLVSQMTDASGAVTSYEYTFAGDVFKTTDALGGKTYTYFNRMGQLIYQFDPDLTVTAYQYDALGNQRTVRRYFDKAPSEPLGANSTPVPTPQNNLDAITTMTYSDAGVLEQITNADGSQKSFTIDGLMRVASETNEIGGVTTYTYDALGRVIEVEAPVLSGTSAVKTVTEYDLYGNVARVTEAYGLAEQRITEHKYDELNRLIETTGSTMEVVNASRSAPYDAKPITTYTYTDYGELKSENMVTEEVNPSGSPIIRTESRTLMWYDDFGRVQYQAEAQAWNSSAGNFDGKLTEFVYDDNGNVTTQKVYDNFYGMGGVVSNFGGVPSGTSRDVTYTYDAMDRVLTQTQAGVLTGSISSGSGAPSYSQSTGDLVTTFKYDALGRRVLTTDANGDQLVQFYDEMGREVARIDGEMYRTSFEYDFQGNVSKETRHAIKSGDVTFTNGLPSTAAPTAPASSTDDRITEFKYDLMGRRTELTRLHVKIADSTKVAHASNTVSSTVLYEYNGLGLVTKKTEATGEFKTFEYDGAGRLTKEIRSANSAGFAGFGTAPTLATRTPTVEYAYDGLGNLKTQTEKSHDGLNDRVTQFTSASNAFGSGAERVVEMTDAEGNVRTNYYDGMGRLTREVILRDKVGGTTVREAINYTYDMVGNLIKQRTDTLDSNDQINTTTAMDDTIAEYTFEYNAHNEVTTRKLNDQTIETNIYDSTGQLIDSTTGDGIRKYFLYDKVGNQTAVITSTGHNTSSVTRDQAIALFPSSNLMNAHSGVVATLTEYDARGLALSVFEPQRDTGELDSNDNVTVSLKDLETRREYNAFGEVTTEYLKSEIDSNGDLLDGTNTETLYTYNTMGRVIQIDRPQVSVLAGNTKTASNARPTEYMFHDKSGRMVGSKDANGNATKLTLLEGTGYEGSEALVKETVLANNKTITNHYDEFGDVRVMTDQLGRHTKQSFDKLGRLVSVTRPDGNIEAFTYDVLGQRLSRIVTNTQTNVVVTNGSALDTYAEFDSLNAGMAAFLEDLFVASGSNPQLSETSGEISRQTTEYDIMGRVVTSVAMGGVTTSYTYEWDDTLSSGLGLVGGWTKETTYANTKKVIEKSDAYDRTISTTDMGNNVSNSTYNNAGWLTSKSGGTAIDYTYFNTGQVDTMQAGTASTTSWREQRYRYDERGNLIAERFQTWEDYSSSEHSLTYSGLVNHRDAIAEYDAMGRITRWENTDNRVYQLLANETLVVSNETSSMDWSYDAVGNIRKVGYSAGLTAPDGGTGVPVETGAQWFSYDVMNRVTHNAGDDATTGGQATGGMSIVYDDMGRRIETRFVDENNQHHLETYSYDAADRIIQVNAFSASTAPTTAYKRAVMIYDHLGRLEEQIDYRANGANDGTVVSYQTQNTYDVRGHLTEAKTTTWNTDNNQTDDRRTVYTYGTAGNLSYKLGQVVNSTTYDGHTGTQTTLSSTVNTYTLGFGTHINTIAVTANSATATTTHTYESYGGQKLLASADITNDVNDIEYLYDLTGSGVMREKSHVQEAQAPDPTDPLLTIDFDELVIEEWNAWHIFGGQQLAEGGTHVDKGMNYVASIDFREEDANGDAEHGFGLVFNTGVERINSYSTGSAGGLYTVQAGDTISSVASRLWGDSSLWWKLAEANGLSGASQLTEGQTLIIPTGVIRNTYNASTFQPHNPAEVIGETRPDAPTPPAAKEGSGAGGKLLLAVIAMAVAAVVAPHVSAWAANTFFGGATMTTATGTVAATASASGIVSGQLAISTSASIIGGAVGGAAGSIVSQGVGVATGIQDKFSWTDVGLAAIGGGVGGANGQYGLEGDDWMRVGVRAAANSAVTQGISMAVGLQSKFDWAGIAGAAAGAAFSTELVDQGGLNGVRNSRTGLEIATGTSSAIANAATRSLIEGSDFGDNLIAALPDVIAQTVGALVTSSMIPSPTQRARLATERLLASEDFQTEDALARLAENEDVIKDAEQRLADEIARLERTYRSDQQSGEAGRAMQGVRDEFLASIYGIVLDDFDAIYSEAQSEFLAAPEQFYDASQDGVDTILVRGDRILQGAAIHRFVDPFVIEGGSFAIRVGEQVEEVLANNRKARIAVQAVDIGLTIAGGPGRFAAAEVTDRVSEVAIDRLSERFESKNYGPQAAVAGGVGGIVTLTLLLSGIDAFRNTVKDVAPAAQVRSWGVQYRNWVPTEVMGRRVYQRNDQFDINRVDKNGRTNLQRMQRGNAPLDDTGKPIQLHHMTQEEFRRDGSLGSLAEVTTDFHQQNYRRLHTEIGEGARPSYRNDPIQDRNYENYRGAYWRQRARGFQQYGPPRPPVVAPTPPPPVPPSPTGT